jgi:nicotinamidase-related amidase
MSETAVRLLIPEECALLLVDLQAGLAFGVGSIDRQMLLNNVIALAKTARTFGLSSLHRQPRSTAVP